MAISEITKQVVKRQKDQRGQRIDAIDKEIDELEALVTRLQAQQAVIRAEYEALDADIEEPVIPEEIPPA